MILSSHLREGRKALLSLWLILDIVDIKTVHPQFSAIGSEQFQFLFFLNDICSIKIIRIMKSPLITSLRMQTQIKKKAITYMTTDK